MNTVGRTALTRIGLLSASLGKGNLGDEATVASVIQSIRRRHPGATIYVLSGNPGDTRQRHHIMAVPVTRHAWRDLRVDGRPVPAGPAGRPGGGPGERLKAALKAFPAIWRVLKAVLAVPGFVLGFFAELRFLVASFRYLRGTDLLFVTGSGVLSDHFGGPTNFPYTFFKWALLAKAARVPLAFASVGAGPLRHRLSRRLVKYALRLAAYRSCRDATSTQIVDGLGLPGPTVIFPDLANGLHIDPVPVNVQAVPQIVGINVFPHCDPRYAPVSDVGKYQRYLATLAFFASWLISHKYKIFLFPTQIRADTLVIRDFKGLLSKIHGVDLEGAVLECRIGDVADLTHSLTTVDLVVATRFHGILLALLMNRPVLALSNHHKMTDLMIDVGQGGYVLDIEGVTCESLIERFTMLASNSERVRREIAARMADYRRALEKQYELVLDLPSRAKSIGKRSAGLARSSPVAVDGNVGAGLYDPPAGRP